jgi:putative nucleotidyltransferase with HDIG domain
VINQTLLSFSPLLERIRAVIPANLAIHLVGGAIRDALLGKPVHDMDFVLSASALNAARSVANAVGGDFFVLDEDRETGRVIISEPGQPGLHLDFSIQRGDDLASDLQARDFTINAIAIALDKPGVLIDPMKGAADLLNKQLRACLPTSFTDDPVRILRGIRFSIALQLRITPDTLASMKHSSASLIQVSAERIRDELFRILEAPRTSVSLRLMDMLGVLEYTLPELIHLRGLNQSPPHTLDAWEHTLDALKRLASVLDALSGEYNPDTASSLAAGLIALRLGRYRQMISEQMAAELSVGRTQRGLLFLSALYHDIAKPQTLQIDEQQRLRFFEHDRIGAEIVAQRASQLRLSNTEIKYLRLIVRHHMRPVLLANNAGEISPRAIYRYFRDTETAGVGVCLLSLADVWATYGAELDQEVWLRQIDVVRKLLDAWWESPKEIVHPPALVNGNDIMAELGLGPGPQVGWILESIREAQSDGQVKDRAQALEYARMLKAVQPGSGSMIDGN